VKAVAVAVAAFVSIAVASAYASASYSDPASDANEAPDITAVTVDDAGSGPLRVRVLMANFSELPPNSRVVVSLDLDRNPATGAGGDEITLRYSSNGTLEFFRWDGSQLIALPPTDMTAELVNGTLSLGIDRAQLRGSTSFGVLAVAARTQQVAIGNVISTDFAPGSGRNVYSAPGPTSFPDPDNDQDVAPDITSIAVSDATGGTIQFKLTTANYQALPPDKLIGIGIDLAGRPDSDDALFLGYLSGTQTVEFDRETRGVSQPADTARVSASHADGVLTFSLHRSELDGASAFGFGVVSADLVGPGESEGEEFEGEVEALDTAPDDLAGPLYQYRMLNPGPLHLRAGTVTASAGGARAGKPFVAAVAVRRLDTYRIVRSGSVRCTASIGGARVSVSGRFRAGRAECRLRVPKAKAGAVLRGTIAVRVAETTHRSSYRFVVR
jgi:hypothetical protein